VESWKLSRDRCSGFFINCAIISASPPNPGTPSTLPPNNCHRASEHKPFNHSSVPSLARGVLSTRGSQG
jgi:hypothetical protein